MAAESTPYHTKPTIGNSEPHHSPNTTYKATAPSLGHHDEHQTPQMCSAPTNHQAAPPTSGNSNHLPMRGATRDGVYLSSPNLPHTGTIMMNNNKPSQHHPAQYNQRSNTLGLDPTLGYDISPLDIRAHPHTQRLEHSPPQQCYTPKTGSR